MRKERTNIPVRVLELNTGQVDWLPKNPRTWTEDDVRRTEASIQEDTDFLDDRPLLVVPKGHKFIAFAGNLRLTACRKAGLTDAPCIVYHPETDEDHVTVVRRAMKDNGSFGSWDFDTLANEWGDLPLTDWGVPVWEPDKEEELTATAKPDLSDKIDFKFLLEITCENETEQEKMFNEMTERGYECRILTL